MGAFFRHQFAIALAQTMHRHCHEIVRQSEQRPDVLIETFADAKFQPAAAIARAVSLRRYFAFTS